MADTDIVSRFLEIADQHEGSEAVRDWDGKTQTYGELAKAARVAAHGIIQHTNGRSTGIGIATSRLTDRCTAQLAALMAGCWYTPIASDYPSSRLEHMCSTSDVTLVISDQAHDDIISSFSKPIPTNRLEDLSATANYHLPTSIAKRSPAIVYFTSGSTGTPRPVEVPHNAIVNLVTDQNYIEIVPDDVILIVNNPCFDVSTFEVFGGLLNGATIAQPSPGAIYRARTMGDEIKRHAVSIVDVTTALLHQLIDADAAVFSSLRVLLFGGERCDPRRIHALITAGRPQHLINVYGPTEVTTFTTAHVLDDVDPFTPVSIGRAINGVSTRVVGTDGAEVEFGEVGELVASGMGVALGYRGEPSKGRVGFTTTPSGIEYHTGDLVTEGPPGQFAYVGRTDDQIKVGGYRIELGEIRSVLVDLGDVDDAHVCKFDHGGNSLLAAFIITSSNRPSPRDIRMQLQQSLPRYMMPSRIQIVDSFPLNQNGKIDKAKLVSTLVKFESQSSLTLLDFVTAELGGVDEDFSFIENGGDSLSAMRVVHQLEVTGFSVEIDDLLNPHKPLLEVQPFAWEESQQPLLNPERSPLTTAQQSVCFLNEMEPDSLAYNFQTIVKLLGSVDQATIHGALENVVQRHPAFRTSFHVTNDGTMEQVVSAETVVSIANYDVSRDDHPVDSAMAIVNDRIRVPFVPTELPPVRWCCLRISSDEVWLLHHETHLVHDGWSFNVFVSDFLEAYEAIRSGERPPQRVRRSFLEYAAASPGGSDLTVNSAFWADYLQGAPAITSLAPDGADIGASPAKGALINVVLPEGLTDGLRRSARAGGVTLFSLMLTIFAETLGTSIGSRDLVVGTAVANRRESEFADTIGMFVRAIPIRVHLDTTHDTMQLAREVSRSFHDASQHAIDDMPWIVQQFDSPLPTDASPLFQTMFSFHDTPLSETAPHGLTVEMGEGLSNGSCKFDLDLVVMPDGDRHIPRSGSAEAHLVCEFNNGKFSHELMSSFLDDFVARLGLAQYPTSLIANQ